MLQKMRMKVQADLEEALKKFKESPPVPLVTIPPTSPQPQTLPSVAQPSNFPGPSQPPRRSRSPAPTREHHRDNKRPISTPLSPPRRRPIPTESRGRRRRSSRPRREGSLRLRPVSPDQRSPSYDFSTATHTRTQHPSWSQPPYFCALPLSFAQSHLDHQTVVTLLMLSARDPAAGNHPIRCTYHFARPPPVHQLILDQKIPHQIQNLDPGRNNGFVSQSPRHTVKQSPLRATCLAGVVQWNPQRRMTLIPGFEAAHLLQHRLRRAQLHLRNGLMAKILPDPTTIHHQPGTSTLMTSLTTS